MEKKNGVWSVSCLLVGCWGKPLGNKSNLYVIFFLFFFFSCSFWSGLVTLVWSWSKCDDTPPRPSSLVVLMFYFVVDIGERREEEGGGRRRGEWRRSKRCLSFILFFPSFYI